MSEKVFVTGFGSISGIGENISEMLDSLVSLKSGIKEISRLDTKLNGNIFAGEVKIDNDELFKKLKLGEKQNFTRTALLGMLAAKEAVARSGIKEISEKRTGLISATTVGGMDTTENYFTDFKYGDKYTDFICSHDLGFSTENIADYLGVKDYVTTISTACSASANAIIFGAQLIKAKILDRVIVGGTDSLTKFTLNGFNTLLLLMDEQCKPFDENRRGLNLGEGAAYLVLESQESVESDKKNPLCEVKGYGNACDAFHQTTTSPNGYGALLAMNKAISMSKIELNEIDYINAHGTGTPNNDLSEGKAIEQIFAPSYPPISSTKSYTGHLLGAAGALEAIISILAIKENVIFPNLNFTTKMKELKFSPATEIKHNCSVNNVLSNSIGFGGNCSSLIFSRC